MFKHVAIRLGFFALVIAAIVGSFVFFETGEQLTKSGETIDGLLILLNYISSVLLFTFFYCIVLAIESYFLHRRQEKGKRNFNLFFVILAALFFVFCVAPMIFGGSLSSY